MGLAVRSVLTSSKTLPLVLALGCGGDAPTSEVAPPPTGPPRSITFANLSLVGSDIDALLEAIFEGDDGEAETDFEFPTEVAALDGERVAIVGYMLPLDYDDDGGVVHFMCVRDFAACCFGGIPRPDEWVDVRMAAGRSAALFLGGAPILVTGALSVGLNRDEGEFLSSAFQMIGESVEVAQF